MPKGFELPEEQIATARNLNTLIQETVLEAINSVNNPNVENDFEKKGLILEGNFFTENINTIIFQLQNIIVCIRIDSLLCNVEYNIFREIWKTTWKINKI